MALRARSSAQPQRSTLDTSASRLHEREEHLQAAAGKIGGHLFDVQILLTVHAPAAAAVRAADRLRQLAGAFGSFTQSLLSRFVLLPAEQGKLPPEEGSLLSHEELATLFHPPTSTAGAERMQTLEFRELEPPARFLHGTESDAVTLGVPLFRGDARTIGMDTDARRRHAYVVGSTGTGKSTLLLNLIHQDMLAGRGVTVLDVHGDLAAAITERVPARRTNDAIVFDAAADHVVSFNPLACPDPARVDQVTSGVVSAMRKLYDSWGPRLENVLRHAVFVAVEQQGTLLDMLKLLIDDAYRETVVARVSDEVVRSFWQREYASWSGQYKTEAVSSVTNKLLPFLTSRQLRAITSGAARQSLSLRRVMDEGKILVVNLSRGRLGQDNATLLGSLLLTSIEQAAMTRAELPEAERRDHFLYLDEFQSLVTPSTAIMLSESRKYRLALTLSHQLTRQLDQDTYHSVIGNAGSIISFRVGLEDAELLAPAMSKHPGQLLPADLCNLPNYTAYARLLIDGHPSRPFSLKTLPPSPPDDPDRPAIVRRTSERRHALPVR
jgi:type IV secretory pathway TraG/TraD family ATPase VirD4